MRGKKCKADPTALTRLYAASTSISGRRRRTPMMLSPMWARRRWPLRVLVALSVVAAVHAQPAMTLPHEMSKAGLEAVTNVSWTYSSGGEHAWELVAVDDDTSREMVVLQVDGGSDTCRLPRLECEAGEFLNVTSDRCETCPEKTFKDVVGDHNCTECRVGYKSDANFTGCEEILCEEHHFFNETLDDCQECAPGFFRNGTGSGRVCDSCPAGQAFNLTAGVCEVCGVGLVKEAFNSSQCAPCADGFRANDEKTACVACQIGLLHFFDFDRPDQPLYDSITERELGSLAYNADCATDGLCNYAVDSGKLILNSSNFEVAHCLNDSQYDNLFLSIVFEYPSEDFDTVEIIKFGENLNMNLRRYTHTSSHATFYKTELKICAGDSCTQLSSHSTTTQSLTNIIAIAIFIDGNDFDISNLRYDFDTLRYIGFGRRSLTLDFPDKIILQNIALEFLSIHNSDADLQSSFDGKVYFETFSRISCIIQPGSTCFPDCGQGRIFNATTDACTSCPSDTFKETPHHSFCRNCPVGTFSEPGSSGSTDCKKCLENLQHWFKFDDSQNIFFDEVTQSAQGEILDQTTSSDLAEVKLINSPWNLGKALFLRKKQFTFDVCSFDIVSKPTRDTKLFDNDFTVTLFVKIVNIEKSNAMVETFLTIGDTQYENTKFEFWLTETHVKYQGRSSGNTDRSRDYFFIAFKHYKDASQEYTGLRLHGWDYATETWDSLASSWAYDNHENDWNSRKRFSSRMSNFQHLRLPINV